jgi:hypothetical protein
MRLESDLERAGAWLITNLGVADESGLGICEVITVPPTDELPYVFEISRGQTLFFSISSSHEVDLVLCEEGAYDDWVDAGFETDRPLEALLVLRYGTNHSLEFKPDHDTVLVAILLNYAEEAVQSIVSASILDSPVSR